MHPPLETSRDVTTVDVTRRFVRVRSQRPDGLVAFDFAIGWPELSVELLLPRPAFDEFCITHRVRWLDASAQSSSQPADPEGDIHDR